MDKGKGKAKAKLAEQKKDNNEVQTDSLQVLVKYLQIALGRGAFNGFDEVKTINEALAIFKPGYTGQKDRTEGLQIIINALGLSLSRGGFKSFEETIAVVEAIDSFITN